MPTRTTRRRFLRDAAFGSTGFLVLGSDATAHNATFRLLPEADFKDVSRDRPLTVEASAGHEKDWLLACRGGKPAWANFDYADALNELLQLGNVATQCESGTVLEFDPMAMRIRNHADADALLRNDDRAGWTL